MSGNKSKFLTWKLVDKGKVIFGKNPLGNIIAKGVVNLSNVKCKAKNVLYVDSVTTLVKSSCNKS